MFKSARFSKQGMAAAEPWEYASEVGLSAT